MSITVPGSPATTFKDYRDLALADASTIIVALEHELATRKELLSATLGRLYEVTRANSDLTARVRELRQELRELRLRSEAA